MSFITLIDRGTGFQPVSFAVKKEPDAMMKTAVENSGRAAELG
jgi:hypothetical protein